MEKSILSKYREFVASRFILIKKSLHLGNTTEILNNMVTLASSMYVIYISAILIKNGDLTLGTMISFNTYINIMYASVNKIWSFNISKQSVLIAAGRIQEIMEMDCEYNSIDGSVISLSNMPCLEMKDIIFSYPGTSVPVLRDLNFYINSYGIYSIVGKNGCGKSTLAKLIVRFYDANKGTFSIDGKDCSEYTLESLRSNITYIQKDDFFFHDTIINNLLMANNKATKEEVYKVCIQANIYDFIMSLPNQFDTLIGEGGSTLSSGQKQKLSIARALLRNTKILILDEVTANLDGSAEKDILSILLKLRHDTIIILISHKASSIIGSDCIFVMEHGEIIASGNHAKLSKECPLYNELFGTVIEW